MRSPPGLSPSRWSHHRAGASPLQFEAPPPRSDPGFCWGRGVIFIFLLPATWGQIIVFSPGIAEISGRLPNPGVVPWALPLQSRLLAAKHELRNNPGGVLRVLIHEEREFLLWLIPPCCPGAAPSPGPSSAPGKLFRGLLSLSDGASRELDPTGKCCETPRLYCGCSGWGPEPEISGFIKALLSSEIIHGAESPNLQPGFFVLTHHWVLSS